MAEANSQAIIRKRKRRMSRWMYEERRQKTLSRTEAALMALGKGLPGFLLAFAEPLGIPSGLYAAYITALSSIGASVRWPMAGALASIAARLAWGLTPRWETLVTLLLLLIAGSFLHGRGNLAMMLCAGLSMLPGAAVSLLPGHAAADVIAAAAGAVIAGLSAPVMYRAISVLKQEKLLDCMEERVAVGYLGAMLLCGGGRILLLGMNVGALGAAAVTLSLGMFLGVGAGCVGGMVVGLVLALRGLPVTLSIALALGGFLAGMAQMIGRRRVTCLSFAAGCLAAMTICGASGAGCAMSAAGASALMLLLPRSSIEALQRFFRRFHPAHPVAGDAYAASALSAWEHTVAAMAEAVPSPEEDDGPRDAAWWEERLCAACPETPHCGCMLAPEALEKAELVWQARRSPDEVWLNALENLRGLGCGRLYCLREAMTALRLEDAAHQREITRVNHQRDMLVTHLTALAGAARRYAMLSSGDNWWDDASARRLRKALAELAYPASLMYVRRVQGHARVAYALRYVTGAKKQAEELTALTSRVLDAPMRLVTCDEDRVTLAERPLLWAETGVAARGCEGGRNGDTAFAGELQDGRWLVALSDGMGHGEQAARESERTVELLRLCLDAGYTRGQTITAVNGMMLLAGRGERFSTVDLVTLDLWTGQATLDKLGAAGSWVRQGSGLTCVSGDALPLGILESVEARSTVTRLRAGDEIVLMTDGVEDAFPTRAELESAVRACLSAASAREAAQNLLDSAAADSSVHADDQTVVVLRIREA